MRELAIRIKDISIHALREEGDSDRRVRKLTLTEFLSTPSARRATRHESMVLHGSRFLSTPSARRATVNHDLRDVPRKISIHALREEGDLHSLCLLTLPQKISIHALREEGDSKNRDKISIFKQIIQHSARI